MSFECLPFDALSFNRGSRQCHRRVEEGDKGNSAVTGASNFIWRTLNTATVIFECLRINSNDLEQVMIEISRRKFMAGVAAATGAGMMASSPARSADAAIEISSTWGSDKSFQKVVDAFNIKKLGVTVTNRFDGDYESATKAVASTAAGQPSSEDAGSDRWTARDHPLRRLTIDPCRSRTGGPGRQHDRRGGPFQRRLPLCLAKRTGRGCRCRGSQPADGGLVAPASPLKLMHVARKCAAVSRQRHA